MSSVSLALEEYDAQYIEKECPGTRFRGTVWEKNIIQLFGDSARFDYAPYLGRMDVIFIDGSHSYEYVRNDTEVALKLAGPSALILWHDYQPFWSGVVRHLEELHSTRDMFKGLRHIEGTSLVFLEVNKGQ